MRRDGSRESRALKRSRRRAPGITKDGAQGTLTQGWSSRNITDGAQGTLEGGAQATLEGGAQGTLKDGAHGTLTQYMDTYHGSS